MFYNHLIIKKRKKSKGYICDTADFCNNRKKSKLCETNVHALIFAQKGIREEMRLMFLKQTGQDNQWILYSRILV